MKIESFFNPTNVQFGAGSISLIPSIISENNINSVLLVTDKGVRKAGLVDRIIKQLGSADYDVYDGCQANPTLKNCDEAFELYKEKDRGLIIALGGGSSLDVGKAISILASNGGELVDYEGIDTFKQKPGPLVAIPTTSGTASEVTRFTVITDEERKYKFTVGGSTVAPNWAILDPDLTTSLPAQITAATGFDALVHAIESYTNNLSNVMTSALAREAIRKISSSLRQAVYNGENLQVRRDMMMGSLLAGLAFNNTRLGACHAMSHPVSAIYGVPHGVANAIIIPHVMRFNSYAVPERFADIAEDMGEVLEGKNTMEKAYAAIEAVENLAEDVGIPKDLKEYNINRSSIDRMAEDAMLSGNIEVNPRATKHSDIVDIFNKIV